MQLCLLFNFDVVLRTLVLWLLESVYGIHWREGCGDLFRANLGYLAECNSIDQINSFYTYKMNKLTSWGPLMFTIKT